MEDEGGQGVGEVVEGEGEEVEGFFGRGDVGVVVGGGGEGGGGLDEGKKVGGCGDGVYGAGDVVEV